MFQSKKGRMMRHPYVSLALIGLATVGVMSISNRVKGFFMEKSSQVKGMMSEMKNSLS